MESSQSESDGASAPSQPIAARIPAELIAEIIEWLHPQNNNTYYHWHEFPWPYTYVCRHWRHTLITTPHLWTTISIGAGYPHPWREGYEHRFDHPRVVLQLELTGTQPLFVMAQDENWFDPKVLKELARHHSRWQQAEISCYRGDMHELLHAQDSWSFDELRLLVFKVDPATPRPIYTKPDVFTNAPKLATLHLKHVALDTLKFPWSQLAELSLYYVHAEMKHVGSILSQCTSLINLELNWLTIDDEDSPDTSIALPRLNKLTYTPSDEAGQLFSHLHMPALAILHIHGGVEAEEIRACFLSSKPPLIIFYLEVSPSWSDQTVDHAVMADILGATPSLDTFAVDFYEDNEPSLDMILALLVYRGDYQLCPNLKGLVLRNASFSEESAELFIKLLASRSIVNVPANLDQARTLREESRRWQLENTPSKSSSKRDMDPWWQRVDSIPMLGLKAILHEVTLTTWSEDKSDKKYFSEAQLSKIKELSEGMDLSI